MIKQYRIVKTSLVAIMLAAAVVLASACANDELPGEAEAPPVTIIEQGAAQDDEDATEQDGASENTPGATDAAGPDGTSGEGNAAGAGEDVFLDRGDASTLDDLSAAQARIESYYFEQTVDYPQGSVFMQVWCKGDHMKLVSSVDGYGLTESYYDYAEHTVINYSPSSNQPAMLMDFDPDGADAPDDPVREDYGACGVSGGEKIGGQYCLILTTPEGDLLWVGTKYGFPLQATFTDSLGSVLTTRYENVRINTVEDEDVLPPGDMEIYYYQN